MYPSPSPVRAFGMKLAANAMFVTLQTEKKIPVRTDAVTVRRPMISMTKQAASERNRMAMTPFIAGALQTEKKPWTYC